MEKNNKTSWTSILFILILVSLFGYFFAFDKILEPFGYSKGNLHSNNILFHEYNGIILSSQKWIEKVDEWASKPTVRAVVISVNSPGGVVGPSQELYSFIKKIREKHSKPVVIYSEGLLASGAYYMSLGANSIVTAPGALVGSIGVIMEFLNLESLYSWAKVKRFSITTGVFKDSGAEYRTMRDEERDLFQNLINDVHQQFKETVKNERNLKDDIVDTYTDGRVMTGLQASKLGFINTTGTLDDAIKEAANLAKLDKWNILKIPKEELSFMDLLSMNSDEGNLDNLATQLKSVLKLNLYGKPLFLMPGTLGVE